VPPEIGEWLALNRDSLPEPPFQMTLVTTAYGVTTAGDRIETNSLPYLIVVYEDRVITPSTGTPPTNDEDANGQLVEGQDVGDGLGDVAEGDEVPPSSDEEVVDEAETL
jgi:hypothetical protein